MLWLHNPSVVKKVGADWFKKIKVEIKITL